MPPTRVSVSVNSGVPLALGLSKSVKVTVPVGLLPPLTVAWSAMDVPTVALGGSCCVLIDGVARTFCEWVWSMTDSAANPVASWTSRTSLLASTVWRGVWKSPVSEL
jgi:hypothetical protein